MLKARLIPTPLDEHAQVGTEFRLAPARAPHYRTLQFFRYFVPWMLSLLVRRLLGRPAHEKSARRLHDAVKGLGGIWILAGQIFALRRDLLPPQHCRELSRLNRADTGIPFGLVKELVEADLRFPLSRHFAEFSEAPYAVSALSQTHAAVLKRNGRRVLVKVQRPEVAATFAQDLRLMKVVAAVLQYFEVMPHLRWPDMAREVGQALVERSDYRYEASGIRQARRKLREHKVYVPRVYDRLSGRRVLTREHVPGVPLRDWLDFEAREPMRADVWLAENNINRKKLALRIYDSFFRQACEDRLYHGDLQTANILLLRDGRFTFTGFDSFRPLDERSRGLFKMMLRAVGEKDFARVADYFLLFCEPLPAVNLVRARKEILRAYRTAAARADLKDADYAEKSVAAASMEAMSLLFKYKIVANWELIRLVNAWASLDRSFGFLFPEANYLRLVPRYLRKSARRQWQWRRLKRVGLRPLLGKVVTPAYETLMFQAGLLRRRARVFEGVVGKSAFFFHVFFKLASRLLAVGLVFGLWLFLHQHYSGLVGAEPDVVVGLAARVFGLHDFATWVVILLVMLYLFRLLWKLQRRLGAEEVRLPDREARS
jgi:ubiquinone biosynthesis protein